MLYHLAEYLQQTSGVPGARLMTYITFRSGAAFLLALIIALVIGRKIIDRLQLMQIGETVRDLGLEGQLKKEGTPTMGGIIIILSLIVPCLLVGNLTNIYMVLMLIATVWCGTIGFLDDYLKIKKHNKDGMKGKFKIVGQVGLGLLVGLTMCLSPDITQRQVTVSDSSTRIEETGEHHETEFAAVSEFTQSPDVKSTQTTIP
ncbi:MAG: phospho-N-acetylmuramoyl-pentapeptide-transferase, partial [Duncaniella sp.]|nr:phospho-N-acetylmuramoyl-pentapeptide-transferase [Duncaniella sp.]